MKASLLFALLASSLVILSGCQTSGYGSDCTGDGIAPCTTSSRMGSSGTSYVSASAPVQQPGQAPVAAQPIVVSATGYAAPMMNKNISKAQARLLTLRGSKIDAYRNLSERVYGLKLRGSSSLRSMMTAHDELQTYVDAYLMGAKVVSQRELEDGTFETIVEMALQESFQQCVQDPSSISSNPACQMAYNNMNRTTQQTPTVKPVTTNFYNVE